MRIIISDTSCLIDLRKADLLAATLAHAEYRVQVALPLARDELSSFAPEDETALAGAHDRHEPVRGSESAVEAVDARPFGEEMGLAS